MDSPASITTSLILKLEARDVLSDEEKRVIEAMFGGSRVVEAGEDIVADGTRPAHSTLVIEGG